MTLNGNCYSAKSDRFGNVTILRKRDLKTVYLQGDDAVEFVDNHRILDAIEYPSGPFQTQAEHIDACLDAYDEAMTFGPQGCVTSSVASVSRLTAGRS